MADFPALSDDARIRSLALPSGKVRAVLDTDTYNEIDDQFAVAYAMLSPEHLEMEAIYAAPFFNTRSSSPADGMEKSYEEILRILDKLGDRHENFVFKGSTGYLPSADEPVDSPAARHLVSLAMADGDGPLYVLAIGAITNVASAILIEPKIIERIVVVWLGGDPLYWPHTNEFNLAQDVPAARVIFDCGVPLVHIPCMNVAEHLRTTIPEIEHYLKGRGPLADYLADIFINYHEDHGGDTFAWSKVIWDISTVAFIVNPQWVPTELVHSPILTDRPAYSVDRRRHLIRIATHAERDAVFRDLFRKIDGLAG
ncbi:MAG: nucleoside hydrolase [Planctomycetes bacterium]|nr:nucleoside hydrolase [Planctomycetota bacterium]